MTTLVQRRLAIFALTLAFCVIGMGAYVRLSDAGLGCPDWPGCYGQLDVPSSQAEIASANSAFPQRPVDSAKAWKEMIHRYLAATLGLSIMLLCGLAWRNRKAPGQPLLLSWGLLGLVIFQGLLGMWTVTLLVKPAIVTAHLAGGLATLCLLWLLVVQLRESPPASKMPRSAVPPGALTAAVVGLGILAGQILLGGWTSSNYAAVGCIEFPACYPNDWWPEMDFREAFVLWRGTGIDYEFGVLDGPARTAIHLTHRIGAVITSIYLLALCGYLLLARGAEWLRPNIYAVIVLLALQVALGIGNVLTHFPLVLAVAHNLGAALLLLGLVRLTRALNYGR